MGFQNFKQSFWS